MSSRRQSLRPLFRSESVGSRQGLFRFTQGANTEDERINRARDAPIIFVSHSSTVKSLLAPRFSYPHPDGASSLDTQLVDLLQTNQLFLEQVFGRYRGE